MIETVQDFENGLSKLIDVIYEREKEEYRNLIMRNLHYEMIFVGDNRVAIFKSTEINLQLPPSEIIRNLQNETDLGEFLLANTAKPIIAKRLFDLAPKE